MKIGIISDTHGLLRAEVFEVFAGVEHILTRATWAIRGSWTNSPALLP